MKQKTAILLFAFALVLANYLVFGEIGSFSTVHYDDDTYVFANPHILHGLSIKGVTWAFTTTEAGFWHPLTWLSFLTDYTLYGLNPGGYHGTNLILHILNTLLIFFFFLRYTHEVWPSAVSAFLFALHPLHVEPVAWIAARKDVLSTFFWFSVMLTYGIYAEHPSFKCYVLVLFLYIAGLMAKPMLVSLPLCLLLIDIWPLKRCSLSKEDLRFKWQSLLMEKIPLFLFALMASLLVLYTEGKAEALATFAVYPLATRIGHMLVSYIVYLTKTFFPQGLAIFYPHPGAPPFLLAAASGTALFFLSYFAWKCVRTKPYITVGWFWYLISLFPVSGIIQLGNQAMADRYSYVPLLGIFFSLTWAGFSIFRKRPKETATLALSLIILFGLIAHRQVSYFRDGESLFRHALTVTTGNYLAHNNLGAALARKGNYEEALSHYQEALKIRPSYADALYNMGEAQAALGKPKEAERYYRLALTVKPNFAEAHNNLGILLIRQGKKEEAYNHFLAALKAKPHFLLARRNLELLRKELVISPGP